MTPAGRVAPAETPLIPRTLVVRGGRPLGGTVAASGFKHSLVTSVAAACVGRAPVRIHNCPAITESRVLTDLVNQAGGSAVRAGPTLLLDPAGFGTAGLEPELVAAIHGSVYLAPALLARLGAVTMPGSGGCAIGRGLGNRRPVSQYLDVLGRFGATAWIRPDGGFRAEAATLRPAEIDLLDYTVNRSRTGPHYSGATKMALLTAVAARGTSVLRNPYPKPDVLDMITLLRRMGADIDHPGDDLLVVSGDPDRLRTPADITLPPDLIEIVTWICAGATLCPGGLTVTGTDMRRAASALAPEIGVLDAMGVPIEVSASSITTRRPDRLAGVDVVVSATGVYSDSQPFIALLACSATGRSRIRETVWTRRFGYTDGLVRLGASMRRHTDTLTVHGPCPPVRAGQRLSAADPRAAAAHLLAALGVPGVTTVEGMHHLTRAYADLPGDLLRIGADIDRP